MISRPSSDHLKLAQLPPDHDSFARLANSFLLDAGFWMQSCLSGEDRGGAEAP